MTFYEAVMIDAGQMYLKDVPVLVDVMVMDNWYEK